MSGDPITAAARRHLRLRDRLDHPEGTFDNSGRFWLDRQHRCCQSIRTPSRSFPFSQMVHGRTLSHVLHEAGLVDREREVRAVLKEIDPEVARRRAEREQKVVALRAQAVRRYESLAGALGCPTLEAATQQCRDELEQVRDTRLLIRLMRADIDGFVGWLDERRVRRGGQPRLAVVLRLWRAGEGEREAMAWRAAA